MEELRSTEILDREIQDDARRKAERILKTADADCEQITAEVRSRIEAVRNAKTEDYRKRTADFIKETRSAIPLEKQRKLVSFVDNSVTEALDSWLEQLAPERRLALLGSLVKKYHSILKGRALHIRYHGYTEAQARSFLEKFFERAQIRSLGEASPDDRTSVLRTDGFVIETDDGTIVCRAVSGELRAALLSEQRQELSEALLGGRLPE